MKAITSKNAYFHWWTLIIHTCPCCTRMFRHFSPIAPCNNSYHQDTHMDVYQGSSFLSCISILVIKNVLQEFKVSMFKLMFKIVAENYLYKTCNFLPLNKEKLTLQVGALWRRPAISKINPGGFSQKAPCSQCPGFIIAFVGDSFTVSSHLTLFSGCGVRVVAVGGIGKGASNLLQSRTPQRI